MSKQTSVEWLIEQLTPSIALQQKYIDKLFKQAKEMEKEQIIDAYDKGEFNDGMNSTAEEYYIETFNK
jgi:hypothetical protein